MIALFLLGYWVVGALWPAKWSRKEEAPKEGGAADPSSPQDASRTPKDPG